LVAHTQDTDAVTPTSFEMCNAEVADIQMIQRTLLVPYAPTTSLCLPVQSGPSLSVSATLFLHLPNLERCQTLRQMPSLESDQMEGSMFPEDPPPFPHHTCGHLPNPWPRSDNLLWNLFGSSGLSANSRIRHCIWPPAQDIQGSGGLLRLPKRPP